MSDARYDAFVTQTLAQLAAVHQQPDVLGHVLGRHDLQREGTWVEFGVASGASLARLCAARDRAEVWGFDSFEGLPQAWYDQPAGAFAQETIARPPPGGRLMVGRFEDTLPCWTPRSRVTLVHIDCDLYASALVALQHIKRFLQADAVVVFDELHRYEGFREHEMRALYESGLKLRWIVSGNDRAAGIYI